LQKDELKEYPVMKAKTKKSTTRHVAKSAKSVTGAAAKIVAAFHAREGTNRAKLLARLASDLGRPVPVSALLTAVYGKATAPRAPLYMVMKGALAMVEKNKPGYHIVKAGEGDEATYTLSVAR
jgi:hypothetical protein